MEPNFAKDLFAKLKDSKPPKPDNVLPASMAWLFTVLFPRISADTSGETAFYYIGCLTLEYQTSPDDMDDDTRAKYEFYSFYNYAMVSLSESMDVAIKFDEYRLCEDYLTMTLQMYSDAPADRITQSHINLLQSLAAGELSTHSILLNTAARKLTKALHSQS